ncbi:serine/threonine-protein phosphatase [candidate division KSB1 bacterium]|nr:serine/threonine-protein phosphatase [candidate division KSB1 bacterium]NIS23918.1 serine/threonine-protein phosphatase [candidate division KSB1 bacterium]NIT70835.1 serine/threonine-protein phosphatase [candidate division KSB1 bacterium]NIU24566.1 serine/threonine-protein phosphatase [candidate division KSB1 bacterium]NIU94521.1 SpoIIE family protein phosphatase [candidate division KSB1 bacterium]
MSNLQASIRILGPQFPGPDVLTHRLNKLFRCNLNLIRFISLFSAAIDLESKSFEYCNAGHHPPIWWRASSQSFQWLNPGGPAIGLTLEPEYKKERLQFGSGDIFVLYTDGLVEARNGVDNEFGEKRLMDYVAEHRDDSPDALLNGLFENGEAFAGSFHDDVTLMVLKVK